MELMLPVDGNESLALLQKLLPEQHASRCPHEGAVGGDDGPVPPGDSGLVPKQALQGEEEEAGGQAGHGTPQRCE